MTIYQFKMEKTKMSNNKITPCDVIQLADRKLEKIWKKLDIRTLNTLKKIMDIPLHKNIASRFSKLTKEQKNSMEKALLIAVMISNASKCRDFELVWNSMSAYKRQILVNLSNGIEYPYNFSDFKHSHIYSFANALFNIELLADLRRTN